MTAAARDPNTSVLVRTLFADAHAEVAGRLTPDQAASLESALVDSLHEGLADAKSRQLQGFLGQALATACGRPGATGAGRAAEALAAAIRDPQTPLTTLKPLAAALAVVSGQLPPKEATSHANQAVDVLDSLWVARTAPLDRASVAEALAAVWTRLGPTDAAARAKRMAAPGHPGCPPLSAAAHAAPSRPAPPGRPAAPARCRPHAPPSRPQRRPPGS